MSQNRIIPPSPGFRQQGMALVIVLIFSFCLMLFLLGFQFFSQSEFQHLERIMVQTTLDHLLRAGLSIAEDKLQKERWYGAQHTRGTHEITNGPIPKSRIMIYADDYANSERRAIGAYEYYMLDHVKVFVEATYRDQKMYAYGKYIISPEPTFLGKSTLGVHYAFQNLNPCGRTFRKMANIRIIREDELRSVPGFSSMDHHPSRKALAAYLQTDLHEFAKRYGRNFQLSQRIQNQLSGTQPTYSWTSFKQLIAGLDGSPPAAMTDNQLKNQFILENLKEFFMTTEWDLPPQEKAQAIGETHIELGHFAPKAASGDADAAIAIVFGGGHPIKLAEGRDYWSQVQPSGGQSAFARFLQLRGISGYPDKPPKELQNELCKTIVHYRYAFKWRAYGLIRVEPDGTITQLPVVKSGGAGAFLYYLNNRGNANIFGPGGGVEYSAISGPTPTIVNYYMARGSSILPLAFVYNIFLKYVDETIAYSPDEYVKDENTWKIPIPAPPTPPTSTNPDWEGIEG